MKLIMPSSADADWVTQSDRDFASSSSAATATYCAAGWQGSHDNAQGEKDLLQAAGGVNIIDKLLRTAKNENDLGNAAGKTITPTWAVSIAGGFVIAILSVIVFFCCCWTACPCCKCCRVGAVKNVTESHLIAKAACWLVLIILVGGIVISSFVTLKGFNSAKFGLMNTACSAAELLNTSLSGQSSPTFLGLLPLFDEFQSIYDSLDNNSAMLTQVNTILDNTRSIASASTVASNTLSLLQANFNAANNLEPVGADGSTKLWHMCEFCSTMASVLPPVIADLEGGVAVAISGARAQVDSQLTWTQRHALQNSLNTSAAPLVKVKALFIKAFSFFTDTTKFVSYTKYITGTPPVAMAACGVLIFWALLLMFCASLSTSCFCYTERGGIEAIRKRGYGKTAHRCACISWCCGFGYVIFAFIIGGIMVMVSGILANLCIVLDDLSKDSVTAYAGALGMNMSGSSYQMMLNVLDQCIVMPRQNTSYNPALLDLLNTTDANGNTITMKEKIVDQVKTPIDAAFNNVNRLMNNPSGGSTTLMSNSNVQSLIAMLANTPVESLIVADPNGPWSSAPYADMSLGASHGLTDGLTTSAACTNYTVPPGFGSLSGTAVPGINSFQASLVNYYGTAAPGANCAKGVVCSGSLSAHDLQACNAGNSFMFLKQNLLSSNQYRCDIFQVPNGLGGYMDCDVKDMAPVGAAGGQYTNDCVLPDGTVKVKQVTCTLAQFHQWVADSSVRVSKVLSRLDDTVALVGNDVTSGLHDVVYQYVVNPVTTIADGVTCGFMGQYYGDLINGMCYQGVYGFHEIGVSYVTCGGFCIVFILLMYIIWRRAIDNVNTGFLPQVKEVEINS